MSEHESPETTEPADGVKATTKPKAKMTFRVFRAATGKWEEPQEAERADVSVAEETNDG